MIELKTINYRGGIARFQVPRTWVEEYQPSGGGTFYEDGPDTGTLRINVMSFEKKAGDEREPGTAYDMLKSLNTSGEVEQLPSGSAIARSSKTTVERDEELLIYTGQVGVWVTPELFRLVVFTYTILSGQEREAGMKQELQLLDASIAGGEYPPVHGVAGDYIHQP